MLTTTRILRHSWTAAVALCVLLPPGPVRAAWSEQNGPHGTDANLNATYVIPFLASTRSARRIPR